jgi:malignant T-cell-amplified sequence
MMPRIQVDTGAIKFVLGGANVMCPGINSPGGAMPVELPEGAPVAVYAQGKESAMAVGILRMSTADM